MSLLLENLPVSHVAVLFIQLEEVPLIVEVDNNRGNMEAQRLFFSKNAFNFPLKPVKVDDDDGLDLTIFV